MLDIIIIGSGVIGASIARELARYQANILVLEKENDVSVGTSKANSGIVHGGFDAEAGSLKAKFNVLGNQMFDQLSKDLDFPFKRNGAFVLAFDEESKKSLETLYQKGITNGVKDLSIITGDQARSLEPYISSEVKYALMVPSSGIVSPYEMTIAYAEAANINGVDFKFNSEVVDIKHIDDHFEVILASGERLFSKQVINCAGVYADKINNLVSKRKLHITPRKGEYCLLDKSYSYYTTKTLFQTPTKMGKGILVAPTTHGNIIVGPTAYDITDKDNIDTTINGLNEVWAKATLTIPTLNKRGIITQFAGLRAHEDGDDFIIGYSDVDGFYNVAGIESPGLSSAPAIAVAVSEEIAKTLKLSKKANYIETRKGIPQFNSLSEEEQIKLISEDKRFGHIICRCEEVSEAQIVMAINRPLGARDMDGIKRRTRSGMGRCQMGFCTPKVMEILAKELKMNLEEVTKFGHDSNLVIGRNKNDK